MVVAALTLGGAFGREDESEEDLGDDYDYTDNDHVDDDLYDSDTEGNEIFRRAFKRNLDKKLPKELVEMMTCTNDTPSLGDALCDVKELYDKVGPQSPAWEECLEHLRMEAHRKSSEMLNFLSSMD